MVHPYRPIFQDVITHSLRCRISKHTTRRVLPVGIDKARAMYFIYGHWRVVCLEIRLRMECVITSWNMAHSMVHSHGLDNSCLTLYPMCPYMWKGQNGQEIIVSGLTDVLTDRTDDG